MSLIFCLCVLWACVVCSLIGATSDWGLDGSHWAIHALWPDPEMLLNPACYKSLKTCKQTLKLKSRQISTHNSTEKVTHTHTNMRPLDERPVTGAKGKKWKSCTALHAFGPVHGKFPSSILKGEPKQAWDWHRVPSCVHIWEVQLLQSLNILCEWWKGHSFWSSKRQH